MTHPLLYEINTRCWLCELSEHGGTRITLANVPDSEFLRWQQTGFTHLWLMGVWTSGPRSRAVALAMDDLRREYREAFGDDQGAFIAGSPYAVAEYRVAEELGGETGLAAFRHRLRECGLKLVLDFVPNHVGLDHAWVGTRPELFVQSAVDTPGTFRQKTSAGTRWLAHGKDPYFPPWTDTVQLDYRRPATRDAMRETLSTIADRCDGVRCDMAMLVLNEVFAKTWAGFPISDKPGKPEFWPDAIGETRQRHPEFLFLAEAYWGLESRLQALGFDYAYDKTLYDDLVHRNAAGVQSHLLNSLPESVQQSAHFLENHDEPRIASILSLPEHRAAALLILSLPGLRFLHEGQITGACIRTPVQFSRRPLEPEQPDVARMYGELMAALRQSAVGQGTARILTPREAWLGNPTAQNFVIIQWQGEPPDFDMAVVNLAPHRSQCYAPLAVAGLDDHNWLMKDLIGSEQWERPGCDLQARGVYLDLPEHGAQLFHFKPNS